MIHRKINIKNLKKGMIISIPHSSLILPRQFYNNLNKNFPLQEEINYFVDKDANKLFKFKRITTVKFKYSRLFCDVERYFDNDKETMSKIGQGYLYTKGHCELDIHKRIKEKYIHYVEKNYFNFHNKLNKEYQNKIDNNDFVLFLDAHTFHDDLVKSTFQKLSKIDELKNKEIPDICIGINENDELSFYLGYIAYKVFKFYGYKVEINFPYNGCLVPTYIDNPNIKKAFIMFEINRRVYSNKEDFKKVKTTIYKAINNILKEAKKIVRKDKKYE